MYISSSIHEPLIVIPCTVCFVAAPREVRRIFISTLLMTHHIQGWWRPCYMEQVQWPWMVRILCIAPDAPDKPRNTQSWYCLKKILRTSAWFETGVWRSYFHIIPAKSFTVSLNGRGWCADWLRCLQLGNGTRYRCCRQHWEWVCWQFWKFI